ncbi:helix-turn-helix domain-containing protein, partial [candidate division WOR-3 bacterium]|nr:helix-turn-helix domain-containing protein [candidate division WOR-3 bacterium]
MNDTRQAAAELGRLLREARLRAGLTQRQVAEAVGLARGYGNTYLSRLEKGEVQNPALWLVLDILRACRAMSADLKPFLDRHLGQPLTVPGQGDRAVRGPRQEPGDAGLPALRQEALEWKVRARLEEALFEELNRLGVPWPSPERRSLAGFARKVFRVLYRTRGAERREREQKLARARSWAEGRG